MTAKTANTARNGSNRSAAFQDDTKGSVAIIFSFVVVIIVGIIGASIDFGTAYQMRDQMSSAADSATLSVVAAGSDSFKAAAALTADGPIAASQTEALIHFNDILRGQTPGLFDVQAVASVIKTGPTLTSTITFSGKVPAHFLGLFGINDITVNGHATSVNGLPAFIDFYLLLDNSPSMGIGATTADQDALKVATGGQPGHSANCEFACHEINNPTQVIDNYTIAHNIGIKTRIDVLREATQSLMDTAVATATVPNQFNMSIDTFNQTTQSITGLTDPVTAKGLAANIDLATVDFNHANNDRWTDFDVALNDTTVKVPVSDSGVDAAHTQKVVFFVTDGVSDQVLSSAGSIVAGANGQPGGNRLIQAVNEDLCSAMKAKGIKVAVIYTTYNPIPANGFYNSWVSPWQDEINPHAKACASPEYFFEVGPNQGIDVAMKKLFLKAVAEARISS